MVVNLNQFPKQLLTPADKFYYLQLHQEHSIAATQVTWCYLVAFFFWLQNGLNAVVGQLRPAVHAKTFLNNKTKLGENLFVWSSPPRTARQIKLEYVKTFFCFSSSKFEARIHVVKTNPACN